MTKDSPIDSCKYSVLQYVRKNNNSLITVRCLIYPGVYCKWLKRFSKLDYLGLKKSLIN